MGYKNLEIKSFKINFKTNKYEIKVLEDGINMNEIKNYDNTKLIEKNKIKNEIKYEFDFNLLTNLSTNEMKILNEMIKLDGGESKDEFNNKLFRIDISEKKNMNNPTVYKNVINQFNVEKKEVKYGEFKYNYSIQEIKFNKELFKKKIEERIIKDLIWIKDLSDIKVYYKEKEEFYIYIKNKEEDYLLGKPKTNRGNEVYFYETPSIPFVYKLKDINETIKINENKMLFEKQVLEYWKQYDIIGFGEKKDLKNRFIDNKIKLSKNFNEKTEQEKLLKKFLEKNYNKIINILKESGIINIETQKQEMEI
jgi:hypothetical protein